jgi:predicted Kef-type K+ transport protein
VVSEQFLNLFYLSLGLLFQPLAIRSRELGYLLMFPITLLSHYSVLTCLTHTWNMLMRYLQQICLQHKNPFSVKIHQIVNSCIIDSSTKLIAR